LPCSAAGSFNAHCDDITDLPSHFLLELGDSSRTTSGWTFALVGYVVNVLAVPFLALAGRWEIAAVLMLTERFGKAIRTLARDAMLSHATTEMGRG
jgi:hypothetical protein